MCLTTVYDKEKRDKIIKKMTKKGGWITVWKALWGTKKSPASFVNYYRFKKGINTTTKKRIINLKSWSFPSYRPYFHSCAKEMGAHVWQSKTQVKKCRIRPSWITAIGEQQGNMVIVSHKIII